MPDQGPQSLKQELCRLILDLSDQQCAVVWEAFKLSEADPSKSPEECVKLARERLGLFNSSASLKLRA